MRNRQGSLGSGSSPSTSINENAIEEGDIEPDQSPASPAASFARRMSFGARALRDVRTGNGNANGRAPANIASGPSVKGRGLSSSHPNITERSKTPANDFSKLLGEGFNWSEQIKNRAERSASINSQATSAPANGPANHQKAASVASVEQPIKEMSKSPKKPDHFQERILKGDFYMD